MATKEVGLIRVSCGSVCLYICLTVIDIRFLRSWIVIDKGPSRIHVHTCYLEKAVKQ